MIGHIMMPCLGRCIINTCDARQSSSHLHFSAHLHVVPSKFHFYSWLQLPLPTPFFLAPSSCPCSSYPRSPSAFLPQTALPGRPLSGESPPRSYLIHHGLRPDQMQGAYTVQLFVLMPLGLRLRGQRDPGNQTVHSYCQVQLVVFSQRKRGLRTRMTGSWAPYLHIQTVAAIAIRNSRVAAFKNRGNGASALPVTCRREGLLAGRWLSCFVLLLDDLRLEGQ